MRCARGVQKVGYLGPMFPDDPGDCSNNCVPIHRTVQILTQSQNSDNAVKQTMFHTENVRLLSESAVFALWTYLPRWWVVLRVVMGKLLYYWVLCACCVETPPWTPVCV